jgi:hypothetical protein
MVPFRRIRWTDLLGVSQLDGSAVDLFGAPVDARLVGAEEARVRRQFAEPFDVGPRRAAHQGDPLSSFFERRVQLNPRCPAANRLLHLSETKIAAEVVLL